MGVIQSVEELPDVHLQQPEVNPICGACLASSAIRCRFVDTLSGSEAPAMFPSNGWLTRRPPPPAPGRVARSPASAVLCGSPTPAAPGSWLIRSAEGRDSCDKQHYGAG